MGRIEGKVAVITGGAGGIGRVVGRRFVDEGASVLLVDVDEEALVEACSDISSNQISYFVGDVTNWSDNQAMIELSEERYGGVDIFLANAGVEGAVSSILDYDEEVFDRLMAINVKGPFLGLKAAVPAMIRRGGGSVVITSSVAGVRGGPRLAPYVTSKHAVVGLMKSAAKEFAGNDIRVNTVNPSPVETRMIRSIEKGLSEDDPSAVKKSMQANIPLGRYGQPIDVANLMLFLASDESRFITGSIHMVDGGSLA